MALGVCEEAQRNTALSKIVFHPRGTELAQGCGPQQNELLLERKKKKGGKEQIALYRDETDF